MRTSILAAGALAVVLLASGCDFVYHTLGLPYGEAVPFNPKQEVSYDTVLRDVQFNDVPTPMGFRLRRQESYSYRSPTFRMGSFVYEGQWTYRLTYAFYMRNLPLHDWEKIDEDDGVGTNTTVWAKGEERLRLYLDTVNYDEVHLEIKVYPEDLAEVDPRTIR
jgi:hypothetical protein